MKENVWIFSTWGLIIGFFGIGLYFILPILLGVFMGLATS